MKPMCNTPYRLHGQRGAALIISLIILGMMTLIGVTNMQHAGLELKVISSAHERNVAFEAAEQALVRIEQSLASNPFSDANFNNQCTEAQCFNATCNAGLCFAGVYAPSDARQACLIADSQNTKHVDFWSDPQLDVWQQPNRHQTLNVKGLTKPVKYIVEFLCFSDLSAELATGTRPRAGIPDENYAPLYRVTALATGNADRSSIMLQATFRVIEDDKKTYSYLTPLSQGPQLPHKVLFKDNTSADALGHQPYIGESRYLFTGNHPDQNGIATTQKPILDNTSLSQIRQQLKLAKVEHNHVNVPSPPLANSNIRSLKVGNPKENFDTLYLDDTYRAYREHYRQRQQMLYTIDSHGILHAIKVVTNQPTDVTVSNTHFAKTAHWSYLPSTILNAAAANTGTDFSQLLMNAKLNRFDVNIFDADNHHPNGWGTILVAAIGPAWIVLDITNPDLRPQLIAEITDQQIGFTASNMDIVRHRVPNPTSGTYRQPTSNQWYIAFGAGSLGATSATDQQPAQLFLFDLKRKTLASFATEVANSLVSGVTVTDWNRDFTDDVIYFGTRANNKLAPDGQLMRATLSFDNTNLELKFSQVLETQGQSLTTPPIVHIDNQFNFWIFASTESNSFVDNNHQTPVNSFYGIKETTNPLDGLPSRAINKNQLLNVSNIQTYTNGAIRTGSGKPVIINNKLIQNSTQMTEAVAQAGGWFIDFKPDEFAIYNATFLQASSLVLPTITSNLEQENNDEPEFRRVYQREFYNGLSPKYSAYIDNTKTLNTDDASSHAIDMVITLNDSHFLDSTPANRQQTYGRALNASHLGGPKLESRRQAWLELPQHP